MTLSINNLFGKFYNWIYLSYPNDVCSFFWGTVIAILLLPFILPGKLIGYLSDDYQIERSIVGQALIGVGIYFVSFIIIMLGNAVLEVFFGYEFIYLWSVILGGLGLGLLALVNFVIIIAVIYLAFRAGGQTISHTGVIDNTADFVGAIKGKYCTKITWK